MFFIEMERKGCVLYNNCREEDMFFITTGEKKMCSLKLLFIFTNKES